MTAFSREDIARLEAAAAVLLASPAHVTAEQRKEAEALFVNLQTNKFTCSECQILMEATNDSFVLFEISKLLGVSILREWKVMNSVSIENILTYILQYITERSELANFVRSELCRCCAKIFKRGILDEHFQSEAVLISKVDKLLSGQDLTMQVLGCDLMEATAAEFSSYWRITDVGITWDFHIRAKREFEKSALRNLFKLSLKTLNDLISHPALSSQHGLTLCGKFLHFAETILSWNFSSQLLPPSLSFHFDVAEATALRPPATYKDIFLHESFLPLFFEIHRKVRFNESLCTISLNCLIMLASLMGEVLTKQETVLGDNPPVKYLSAFMSNTTSLFSGGPLPGETSGLCTIIYKLITFHHISSLFHADRSVLQQFLSFLSHYSQSLTSTGIRLALVEDDYELIHSVSRLFESWLALLRGAARIQLSSDLLEPTFQIYSCFLKAVLSSPFGMREKLCSEDTIKDDINEQDDRVAYSNVLVPLGGFGSFAASQSFSVLFEILATLLTKFFSFLSSGMNEEVVNDWREDMHWILLIIGHTLASEDGDGSCQISPEVFDYCEDMVKNGSTDPSRSDGFLSLCVSGPSSVPGSVGVDPFIRITGLVLLWNVLDHRILGEYGINAVSPELMRSSIWCIRRLVAALSDCEQPEAPNDNNAQYSPMLSKEGEASSKIVKFALHRCFGAIQKFPAERKLCDDAVAFLDSIINHYATQVVSDPALFELLSELKLDCITSRRPLLAFIVSAATLANDETVQRNVFDKILVPLMSKFDSSSLLSSTVDSDILDLIDCFHGIALSMRAETSQAIFDYLTPVCIRCIDLLSSRKDSRSIVDGVLGFFQSLCKKLSSFFESDQLSLLYEIVMQLIMAYSKNHICKYRTRGADEEDQISDLICFIEILDSAVSTGPIFGNLAEPSSGLSGGTVAIRGLQELLPLMNGSVMSFPPVCKAFYRFMLRISEEIPDCFKNMDLSLFDLIIECLRKAIASEYGQEIAYLSLQTIDELASNASKWLNKELTAKLTSLVEDTFLACLVLSSDEQLLVRGTFALFGLICLDQAVFGAYVQSLLNRQANRPIREMLEHAFSALLPSPPSSATRGEKRAFSRRFESFVEAVRGQLVLD